jgi:outer membrane protein assembly factor BamB
VDGNLITYLGFKEMLVFGGSSGKIFSVDADLNKLLWEAHLAYQSSTPQSAVSTLACPGGMTAPVVMPGSSSASMHFASGVRRAIIPARPPALGPRDRPMTVVPPFDPRVTPLSATTVSHLAIFYAISSDGELHLLNSYTGEDLIAPLKFVPPNSKITSLNLWETTLYATTADDCNGQANALYSLDFLRPDKYVWSFTTNGSGFSGIGGTAIGRDGTVYVQVASGSNSATGPLQDTVLALTSKDLRVKDYFTPSGKPDRRKNVDSAGITPTVLSWKGKEFVAAADSNGRLYLLDSTMLGGADHHTPVSQTDPLVDRKNKKEWYGFHGTFTTWLDVDTETRWLYAPYWGALTRSDGDAETGRLLAFKIAESSTQPTLDQVWVSPGIRTPGPAVVANGLLFTLSSGEAPSIFKKRGKLLNPEDWERMTSPAVLYAFDAITGKQLYSSGGSIKSYSRNSGLALANGRIYFGTHDNDVYCFGIPGTQPQLTVH